MKVKTLLLLILSFVFGLVSAFSQTLRGLVVNERTGEPLPYANIYLVNNNQIGTVTNKEGVFRLVLPPQSTGNVAVSFIGFEKKVIALSKWKENQLLTIRLTESRKLLDEVVIMPDDAIRKLLKEAYDNIEVNYPVHNTLIKGFYRETNQILPEEKFIYFSESQLEFYQPSYSNSHFGPVRIEAAGNLELKSRRDSSQVYFYAGPYIPQRLDFVKQRMEFIDPAHYEKYIYELNGETNDDDKEVMIIKFHPKTNALFEGTLHIEKRTLAYTSCFYKLSPYGVQKENQKILSKFRYENRKYIMRYKNDGKLWQLHLAIQDGEGINKTNNTRIRYTNEFFTVSTEKTDTNPINESEAITYSQVYTKSKFNDDYWKNSEQIERSKEVKNTIDFLFHHNLSDSLKSELNLQNGTPVVNNKKKSKQSWLSERTSSDLYVGISPLITQPGFYQLSYRNAFLTDRQLAKRTHIPTIGYNFTYHFSRSFLLSLQLINSIDSKTEISFSALTFRWNWHVAGWKRPFYIQPGLGIYKQVSVTEMGKVTLQDPLAFGGKTIRAGSTEAGVGERKYGLMPSLQFVYKYKISLAFFCETSASVFSRADNRMVIEETHGLFARKSWVNLNQGGIEFLKDGNPSNESALQLKEYGLFINAGIRLGVR